MEPNGKVGEERGQLSDAPRTLSPPHLKKRDEKADTIRNACKWKDLDALRTSATSEGGLISDDVRRQACSYYLPTQSCFFWLTFLNRASAVRLR